MSSNISCMVNSQPLPSSVCCWRLWPQRKIPAASTASFSKTASGTWTTSSRIPSENRTEAAPTYSQSTDPMKTMSPTATAARPKVETTSCSKPTPLPSSHHRQLMWKRVVQRRPSAAQMTSRQQGEKSLRQNWEPWVWNWRETRK